MAENNLVSLSDIRIAIPILQDIIDESTLKIISSIIDIEKNVFQICYENKLPLSSTYKKIRKLNNNGLVSVGKIDIDSKGRKVVFYKSRACRRIIVLISTRQMESTFIIFGYSYIELRGLIEYKY